MSQARTHQIAEGNVIGASSKTPSHTIPHTVSPAAEPHELPDLPPSHRITSLIAGICAGIIVVSTAVLMMPLPAMAAGNDVKAIPQAPHDGDEVQALRLQRHALNAFLVPVIDDTETPRWTKNIAAMHCAPASRLFIDGKPMKPGAAVPTRPFTMSWSMVDCHPLDRTETFNGNVKLTVFPSNEGYTAIVSPSALKVVTYDSTAVWSKTFAVGLTDEMIPSAGQ